MKPAAALLLLAPLLSAPAVPPAAVAARAGDDGPGALSHFDLARKDCLGTSADPRSKVWYTVAGGLLSDVYSPTIDNTDVETLRFEVTDGSTFTERQDRDTTYSVRAVGASGMQCEVTSTARSGRYQIVTRYVTDTERDAVVMRVSFRPLAAGLRLLLRLDGSVNGNGGGGPANGGADSATASRDALVQSDANTVTDAVNRDYAVPLAMALRADRPFLAASSGYAGTASDALTARASAVDGNVVQYAELDLRGGDTTLALGFGADGASASAVAGAAAGTPFQETADRYTAGWAAYDQGLREPPASLPPQLRDAYRLSANVLKASEDKTFPGAIVASLASPWGQAVSAGDTPGGRPVYFGSYREVFARDLYETFTGLLAAGDLATARATVRFLFQRQQLPDGRFPRNSLINGRVAPDTGGDQLDESAYPVLMAYQSGLDLDPDLYPRIRRAADFVVAHGPSFGSERWEEQSGYSPSTIAAEIAGLVAAGLIADRNGDHDAAAVYRATADHFQRSIKGWAVTTSGPYAPRYFIRLAKTGDPDAAVSYNLGNGGPDADQRTVVDQGFLELTRLGILPADDADVLASLAVTDRVIQRPQGVYRYGVDTPGTEDGYGDCYVADPTGCTPDGKPWPTGNTGSGHVWPVLSGERGEHDLALGDRDAAVARLRQLSAGASGVGLVPEQVWENPPLAAAPAGTPPETASIGFTTGQAAGSASPLTWAQAQFVRLALGVGRGRPVAPPPVVADRYVHSRPPRPLPVRITAPATGGATVTVTGRTTPCTRVTVAATPTDVATPTTVVTTVAHHTGRFSVTVPLGYLTNVLTVSAAHGGGTGYAQTTVVSTAPPGPVLLDAADPAGDDDGPGTYAYPTAADFHAGAFDIRRFQVVDAGATVYLRTELRDLTPTFGSPLGAQLLDVFVRDPGARAFSTAPPHPARGYTLAPGSAWSSRVEVQGFAGPVFVDADGGSAGGVTVTANQATGSILVAVPKAALGTPRAGWVFTVVVHGQDGYGPGQARGFAATPQPYAFGVCAAGGTAPICSADPAGVPRVIDTVPPPGVSQADELTGTARLNGVTVAS